MAIVLCRIVIRRVMFVRAIALAMHSLSGFLFVWPVALMLGASPIAETATTVWAQRDRLGYV